MNPVSLVDYSAHKYHLTFDIDWAPDFCVASILDALNNKGIIGTFFVTHQSDVVSDLIRSGHNVGIHPNFLQNSSHGQSVESVIEYLLKIVPDADSLRTHALVQSSPLLSQIFKSFPQLKYDFSIFMHAFPMIKPFRWSFDGVSFTRINYNWEDDATFFEDDFAWSTPIFYGDVNIFDFHPIHVSLNSKDENNYKALKVGMKGEPLWNASIDLIKSIANRNSGTRTFFESLIASNAEAINFRDIL